MQEYITINAIMLRKIVNAASVVSEKAVFTITDKLNVRAVNPVVSVDITLDGYELEDYIVNGEHVITLDLTELSQALRGVMSDERVVLEPNGKLRIIGKTKRDITLNVSNGTKLSMPEVDPDVVVDVDGVMFSKFIKSMASLTNTITFEARDGKFNAIVDTDTLTATSDFDARVIVYRRSATVSYPLYNLAKIVKNHASKAITIGFSTVSPLRLLYEKRFTKIVYYLMPWR